MQNYANTETGTVRRLRTRPRLHEPVSCLRHAAATRCRGGVAPESARSRLHAHRHGRALRLRRQRNADRPRAEGSAEAIRPRDQGRHVRERAGPARDRRPARDDPQNCEDSLRRLQTDVIDLYYLHRWDKRVPVEESIGALVGSREGRQGQGDRPERGVGRDDSQGPSRAPVAAVQTEYSLWTRNAEVAVLDTCRELGITFVAFSPLGRGFLTGSCATSRRCRPRTSGWACRAFRRRTFEEPAAARWALRARRRTGLHDGTARARLGARAGPAHRPDSGDDAARSPRGERAAQQTSRCRATMQRPAERPRSTRATVSGTRYAAGGADRNRHRRRLGTTASMTLSSHAGMARLSPEPLEARVQGSGGSSGRALSRLRPRRRVPVCAGAEVHAGGRVEGAALRAARSPRLRQERHRPGHLPWHRQPRAGRRAARVERPGARRSPPSIAASPTPSCANCTRPACAAHASTS